MSEPYEKCPICGKYPSTDSWVNPSGGITGIAKCKPCCVAYTYAVCSAAIKKESCFGENAHVFARGKALEGWNAYCRSLERDGLDAKRE